MAKRWIARTRWVFAPIGAFAVLASAPLVYGASAATTPSEVTAPQSANLLTVAQSAFDGATGSWTAAGGTVAPVATPAHGGTGALAVTAVTDASGLLAVSGSGTTTFTPASPGARYTSQLWTTAQTTSANVAASVVFLDTAGHTIATATGQAAPDAVGSWQQTASAIGVAPANTAYVAAGVTIANVKAGESHVVDDAALTTSPGGSADVSGPLRTVGNRILDANGNPVVLRGFTRVGMEGSGDAPGSDELGYAKRWGANIIRLPVTDAFWLPTSCRYDSSYAAKVDKAVAAITSLGMVALVDLH